MSDDSVGQQFGVIGIPWDVTSSYPGPFNVGAARQGPRAFRTAFDLIKVRNRGGQVYFFGTRSSIALPGGQFFVDRGDVELRPTSIEDSYARIEAAVRECVRDGQVVIAIGGDDGVTYPVVKGVHDAIDGSWGMIHLDAHMDLLDESEIQGRLSSSSGVRRSTELPRFRTDAMVQLALRNFNFLEQIQYAESRGITQITADEFTEMGTAAAAAQALEVAGAADHIHLSFDMDAVDPAFAKFPGGGEPGGLTSRQVLDFIRLTAPRVDSISIVEIYPIVDDHNLTGGLVAQIVGHFIVSKLAHAQSAGGRALGAETSRV